MKGRNYEAQARQWHGPGLSQLERAMVTYLELEVVNARRLTARDFDVDIDFIAPGMTNGAMGWMPLVVLHEEWRRRPEDIGGLAEAAGGRAAEECAKDWDYIRDLDDHEKFIGMCHGVWALVCARSKA